MKLRRVLTLGVFCAALAAAFVPAAGCSEVALDKVVVLTDIQSGYIDMGIVNGETRLIPSTTVRVKNTGTETLAGFKLSAAFWRAGEDGQKDDVLLQDLVAKDLAPGATSDPIDIRAKFGYKLEGARADFFSHSMFIDFTIKIFGKVAGKMFKIGEVPVERKILAGPSQAMPTK